MVSAIYAQASNTSLAAALNSSSDISSVSGLITSSPELLSALSNAQNITLLAPSNNAISRFLNSTAGAAASTDSGYLSAVLYVFIAIVS